MRAISASYLSGKNHQSDQSGKVMYEGCQTDRDLGSSGCAGQGRASRMILPAVAGSTRIRKPLEGGMWQEKMSEGKDYEACLSRKIRKSLSRAYRRITSEVSRKRMGSLLIVPAMLGTLILPALTRTTAPQTLDAISALARFNILATNIPPPPPNTNPNVIVLPFR